MAEPSTSSVPLANVTLESTSPSTPAIPLQFTPLPTLVSPNFWHTLTNLKLDKLRLNEDAVPIEARYTLGRVVQDRRTGGQVHLGGGLKLDETSFGGLREAGPSSMPMAANDQSPGSTESSSTLSGQVSILVKGTLQNYNTAPQFTSSDKNAIFSDLADEIYQDLMHSSDPLEAVMRFTVLSFSDLKKYKFYHWAALPALIAKPNWQLESPFESIATKWGQDDALQVKKQVEAHVHRNRGQTSAGFAVAKRTPNGIQLGQVVDFESFFAGVEPVDQTVVFFDPSATPGVPGWPLRNFLALLSARYGVKRINAICWRDELGTDDVAHSLIGQVYLPDNDQAAQTGVLSKDGRLLPLAATPDNRPLAVGWERNAQGKLAPKVADLGPLMDPIRLADQAVDLNLKLMRWRIMPEIQLENIAATKCLLLGAGTLGCYVARTLLGWGVRNITLLDSSKVSYSNPVRQPLFEFEDCLGGGKPKAQCAAERLTKIFPGVNAKGIQLSVPMPGHGLLAEGSASETATKQQVEQLEQLFDKHDVIFLLMDSRESRWLPSLLGAAKGKIVMNAALGFDSYLVMRHGGPPIAGQPKDLPSTDYGQSPDRLGCYFCNDVMAPSDSLTDRTLDQMCTVTRPGLAAIAGGSAVELLMSLLQHNDGCVSILRGSKKR